MKVVGIFRGQNKENKSFTVLHVIKDFDDYQLDNAEGNAVDTLFIRGQLKVDIGNEIDPIYGVGYQGKAIVKDIVIF